MNSDESAISPAQARQRFRDGQVTPTAGWSAGYAQANLIAVPRDYAFDVLLFAQRNPKPCPVLDVLEPGQYAGPLLPGGDIRTDIPAYRIYVDGELVGGSDIILEMFEKGELQTLIKSAVGKTEA